MSAPEFSDETPAVKSPAPTAPVLPRFLAHDDDIAAAGDDHRDQKDELWHPDKADLC